MRTPESVLRNQPVRARYVIKFNFFMAIETTQQKLDLISEFELI